MKKGGAGKDANKALCKGCGDDESAVIFRGMNGGIYVLKTFDSQFQQPGDNKGAGVGADEKEDSKEVAPPAGPQVLK